MSLPGPFRRPPKVLVLGSAAVLAAALIGMVGTSAAQAAEIYPLPPTGSITVTGNGNGHGHGMSQYGARGAAIAGLNAAQIVAFYYPGTTLVPLAPSLQIRVYLPSAGGNTCVQAVPGLSATGIGALRTAGVTRFRLVPSGGGLALQRGTGPGCTGAGWSTYAAGLPAQVDFSSSRGYVHMYRSDGTSTDYRGSIGALRSGAGELTINRVGLDDYAMGVAPREMPASWQNAAVQAQAIAARSYGEYAREHNAGNPYDICDTDWCQVYGGMTHYDAAGNVLWRDDPAAVVGNASEVIQYHGATAFTQFSASDGGWTVDGGQPYLIAKADPYDNPASGDPYLDWTKTVPVAQIAAYYGLSRVSSVVITSRDGHGAWGGRVLSGQVVGTTSSGVTTTIGTTGWGLQAAMGLLHNWFTIGVPTASPPRALSATGADGSVQVSWQPPASSGSAPINGYAVTVGTQRHTVGASTRALTAIGLINGRQAAVSVSALTALGSGQAATTAATPNAVPQTVAAVTPARVFDTRFPRTTVDAAHPYVFTFAGKGGVPARGAVSVQFALTIVAPSAAGTLHVQSAGAPVATTSAISYSPATTITTTVSVPLVPTASVTFAPSAGSLSLIADVMSYAAPGLASVASTPPTVIISRPHLPTGTGVPVRVRGVAGVPANASAVVLSVTRVGTGSGWLRVWPAGFPPYVSQATTTGQGGSGTVVIVPIGANGGVRIAASSSAVGGQLAILGYLAPAAIGRGTLEAFQATGLADTPSGIGQTLKVGTAPLALTVLGQPQLPPRSVQAVLLQVTVSRPTAAGFLYAWAAGTARPGAAMSYPAGGATTSTVFVRVGTAGAVDLALTGGSAAVSVDVVGWVSAG